MTQISEVKNFFEIEDSPSLEIYFATKEEAVQDDEGLIWKDILREGEWAFRPGPNQKPVPVPLKVTAGKASTKKEIGMQDLIEAFEDGAIDHVTVPTSHSDQAHENTGYVRGLKIVKRDGKNYLRAGIKFTEPDIEGKVIRKSIANTSAGIIFNYVKKDSGKVYGMALGHVALTNKPWINGMEPFSEEFSEDETDSVILADVVWNPDQSLNAIRQKVSEAISNSAKPGEELLVADLSNTHALVINHNSLSGNKTHYVVPFSLSKDEVTIENPTNWTEAQQEWIKTSEELAKSFADEFRKEKEETLSDSARSGANRNEGDISNMSDKKEEKDSQDPGATPSPDPAPVATELSEEAKDKIKKEVIEKFSEEREAQIQENKELRKKVHKMTVDSKIADLSESLSGHPGILKEVREIMLADEAGSTVLTLSEEVDGEKKDIELSASDIAERIINVLPKKDGKVNLGDQTNEAENHDEPKEEEELSVEERAAKFAEDLGITDYPAPKKEGEA